MNPSRRAPRGAAESASAHSARPKENWTEGRRRFIVSSFVVSLFLLFWCFGRSLFCSFVVWSFVVSLYCRFTDGWHHKSTNNLKKCTKNVSQIFQNHIKSEKSSRGPKTLENSEGIGPTWPWRSQGWAAVTSPRAQRMYETSVFEAHPPKT